MPSQRRPPRLHPAHPAAGRVLLATGLGQRPRPRRRAAEFLEHVPGYGHGGSVLKAKDLNLAFIHLIEARVSRFDDVAQEKPGQHMEFAYSVERQHLPRGWGIHAQVSQELGG
ncbi:hypothetical protein PG991_002878 [Apiospora marii]|uniref:Uncharacterized protein n=1 Tax=Apiospora marii TaxID=335849 RepID=A0ABR1SGM4_9PEZI